MGNAAKGFLSCTSIKMDLYPDCSDIRLEPNWLIELEVNKDLPLML